MTETEPTPTADGREGDGRRGTMADVSHTHPETHETFGATYRRGPAVTDGGSARTNGRGAGRVRAGGDGATDGTIADVDHEPPYPDAAGVWSRGVARGREEGDDG